MSQKTRAVQDVSVVNWTPTTNLYQRVDEIVPGDSDYAESAPNIAYEDHFEVLLAPLAWPQSGPQTIRIRARRAGPTDVPVNVRLLQGSQLIASRVFLPGSSFGPTLSFELSEIEKARITDYTNLRLRVSGTRVSVNCCTAPVSVVLFADLVGCVNGTVRVVYDGTLWFGSGSVDCIDNMDVTLVCDGEGWTVYIGPQADCNIGALTTSTSPFRIEFPTISGNCMSSHCPACLGSTITITARE